jgi:hypothetical protein
MNKGDLYKKARELGYTGALRWKGSTKEQWKTIVERLENEILRRPNYQDNRAVQPEGLPVMFQEVVREDDPKFRTIRFPLEEYIGDNKLYVDNADTVKEVVEGILQEVKDQIEHIRPAYQLKFVLHGGNAFATRYLRDSDKVLEEADHYIDTFAEKYDTGFDEELKIDYIEVNYIIEAEGLIRGASKAISDANERWYMPDTNTRKNCFFIAMYTCLNWESNMALLTDSKKRTKDGEKYKNRLAISKNLKEGPTFSDFESLAKLEGINLIIYNNLFEKVAEYWYGHRKVTIKVADEHAIPMIPRKKILAIDPAFDMNYQTIAQKLTQPNNVFTRKIYSIKEALNHNTRYVSWDLETHEELFMTTQHHQRGQDKRLVVYTSGLAYHEDFDIDKPVVCKQFFTNQQNLKQFIAYVKENIELFKDTTFYAHNGGRFDVILLLRDAILADPEIELLGRKLIELNNALIGVSIKYRGEVIHFKDSYRLFQSGLGRLTKEFKVNTPKGHLDHKIITADTYEQHKDEVLEYHRADCVGLLECIDKFAQFAFGRFNINITDCFTAASFSKRINKTKYMKTKHGVYRLATPIDKYIRTSYLGGRNECFMLGNIPGNAYYYDFTSLYPFAGTNFLPVGMPSYQNYRDGSKTIQEALRTNQMGFIKCMVKGTAQMLNYELPLHGVHQESRLLFPYIENPIEMTLFTQEIKEGLKLGYTYEPIDGYSFNRDTLMKDFFMDCFEYKKQAKKDGDKALEMMWKIIINSGYGFWGYNPGNNDTIKLYSKGSRGYLEPLAKQQLKAVNQVEGYTFARVANDKQPSDTNVGIAAAITSYARIYLHRAMTDIRNAGGILYYCDTDSIICDLKLSDHPELIKKWRKDRLGNDLGSLKNELGLKCNDATCCGEHCKHEGSTEGTECNAVDVEDLPLTDLMIAGCKMYACSGINFEGKNKEFNKLKGYKRVVDGNETITHEASRETINKIVNGYFDEKGEFTKVIHQVQSQLLCNKNDLLRNGNEFQIRITDTKKRFTSLYTKGDVVHGTTHSIIFPKTI